ncbi:septation protein A [Roseateles sp. BYS180W]|uniref:Inner membrane-spanning protein YciB n=1 Tax=Roseateles rivi TaxID=3299028 RepID=A0ABW7FVZ3_9BURK
MKLLLDFLPLLLFFGTFKLAQGRPEAAAAFATQYFGALVSGGAIQASEAPVLLATVVVMVSTLLQALITKLRGQKIDTMLWISLTLVVVLGGATLWFHNATFIKWKPTLLYWGGALAFLISQTFFGKNLIQAMLGKELKLPDAIWRHLNWAWVVFCSGLGCLNLWVAYHYSDETWASFKVFGVTGLILLFTLAQGLYLMRHLPPAADDDTSAKESV